MPKFSDRLGVTQPSKELQVGRIDADLYVSLWNWTVEVIQYDKASDSLDLIWKYLRRPLNQLQIYQRIELNWLYSVFMNFQWYEVYNFVEFLLQDVVTIHKAVSVLPFFERQLNRTLEFELSGYRVINMEIVPIADESELAAIRQVISKSGSDALRGPREHIAKALSLLSKKPEPDYENSIKESISAVESISKLLTNERSGGLDKALEKLSSKVEFHPALKRAFSHLYGFTSDQSGIRHAILDSKEVGFAEAKFMLVTCSAFVNFVLETAKRANLI